MSSSPSSHIVVVDDNEDDIFVLHRLLKAAGVQGALLPLRDGEEAVKYFGRVANRGIERPQVCFLDIKMPGYSGFEVLEAIRASAELDPVSVIVLSTSDDRRDIVNACKTGAQCYLVKFPPAAVIGSVVADALGFSGKKRASKRAPFAIEANLLPR